MVSWMSTSRVCQDGRLRLRTEEVLPLVPLLHLQVWDIFSSRDGSVCHGSWSTRYQEHRRTMCIE